MIHDPAQMLERIPELQPLCSDPQIARAVESGDPFKVHRALMWAKLFGRLQAHRDTVAALVRNRRLFAKPLRGTPTLFTFNSVGLGFVGASERDEHSYIAVHALVALFAVPLFPLGAYVVQKAPGSGGRSQYRIFARVPMDLLSWLWSRGLALAALALVAWGGLGAVHSARYRVLHLVNGLEVAVRADVDGRPVLVAAGGYAVLPALSIGQHHRGRAVLAPPAKPLEIDAADIDVDLGNRYPVWNIAGSAPLALSRVVYSSSPSAQEKNPEPQIYCGKRVLAFGSLDYPFQEPPTQISMSEGEGSVTRTSLTVLHLPNTSGAQLCAMYLSTQKQLADAQPLVDAMGAASGNDRVLMSQLVALAATSDPEQAYRLAGHAHAAHPEDLDLERQYQELGRMAGHGTELLAAYRKRAEAAPDGAREQYLYARLLHGPEASARFTELATRFPNDPAILRALVFQHASQGEWQAAEDAWQALARASPQDARSSLELRVTALAGLGRGADALDAVEQAAKSAPAPSRDLALLYARLATLLHQSPADALITAYEAKLPSHSDPALRSAAGLPAPAPGASRVATLEQAARSDPQALCQAAAKLKPYDIVGLDPALWMLAYGESVLDADAAAQKALEGAARFSPEDRQAIHHYVLGESADLTGLDLDPESRAAVELVRARNPKLPLPERRNLLADAHRLTPLPGVVSGALEGWKS